ncbi:MAG: CHAP domain-containing protein [Flectobacillus sp.]|nr:CHAP domain-containing protein [Flectobacillus sp.]
MKTIHYKLYFLEFFILISFFIHSSLAQSTCTSGSISATFNNVAAKRNCPMGSSTTSGYNYEAGINTGYKWQCVEYVNRYYYLVYGMNLKSSAIYGNAKGYYESNVHTSIGLVKYANGGSVPPEIGDILVSTTGTYGHVAIVQGVSASKIDIIDQNFSYNSSRSLTRNGNTIGSFGSGYTVSGWVRKKNIPTPPTTPTLSYPVANATNISRIPSVNLGWAGSNATEYRIQIVDAKSFTGFDATSGFKNICNTCVNENVKSATTYSFKGATANTTYYWTVRASGSGGVSKFSAYNKFTTASDPATIPVLASPADNASNISTTTPLQFTWSASNATEYRIQIIDELKYTGFDATNGFANNCATCLKTVHLANQSSYSLSNLEAGKTYYWTVRANGLGGTSKYATVRKFKTAGGAVPAPTIQPISVSICQGAATTLSATGCAGVVTWSDTKTGTSRNISPTATATYTATCTVGGKVSSKSNTSTITVNANPTAPTLTASPTTISNGGASTLKATNCNGTVYWSNGNTGTQIVVKPTTSTNYSANCKTNSCTSSSATVAVQVVTPATIPALSLPADNASNISTTTPLQFSWTASNATEYRVQIIDALKYTSFDATNGFASNCTSCLKNENVGNVSSYSLSNLEAGKTYYWTVRANGPGGTSKYATVRKFTTVVATVNPPTIQPSSVSICQGATTTLSATGCSGTITWNDGKTGPSRSMSPTATATYTATCTVGGKVSSKSNTSTITVNANPTTPTLMASPTTISNGGASTLRAANCNGTVYWSNGDTGTQIVVKPTTSTNYSAYCKTNSCTSSSATVAVQVSTPTPSTSNPSIGTYTSCSGSGSQSSSCGSFLIGIIRAKVTSINNGYATIIVSKCNGSSFSTAGTAYAKQSNICGSILTSKPYTLGSGDVTLSVPVSVGNTNIYITVNSNTGDKFATGIITINRSNSAARVSAEEQISSDNSDQEMVVYPNPTAGEFKIKLANHISKDEVVLIHINSLTNTEFHEEKRVSIIELENIIFHLPQGLYTVNIEIPTLEKFLSSKIIVTK